jgi:acyl-CoA synthetase (AMP-forming)/AMP-acid ligase II
MYGLTEAFRSTYLEPERFAEKRGSIGQAIPNVETFVVVPGRGLAQPGEEGELVHRGSLISRGYWRRPEATAAKIKPCPELGDQLGGEPVVFSGDLVRADADGDLWFVGRGDGMIKSMGFRLAPSEVEDIVHGSGLVHEVVAFGVEDELAGQVVHVCVSAASDALDRRALLAHCRAHMPHYMLPKELHTWPGQMPRTASGKIDVPAVVRALKDARARDS